MTKNQECLEAILGHLTKLILLTENGDIDELERLTNIACTVSAQLLAAENGYEEIDDDEGDDDVSE